MTFLDRLVAVSLPRSFVIALLICVSLVAFVITPYWFIPVANATRFIILFGTLVSLAAWCYISGASFTVRFTVKGLLLFLILLTGLFVINYRSLTFSLVWKGDEPYHIGKILGILYLISGKWYFLGLAAFLVFLVVAWWKPAWMLPAAEVLVIGIVFYILAVNPYKDLDASFFMRYPFGNYWYASVVPYLGKLAGYQYQEIYYRLIPFFAACAIAWAAQQELALNDSYLRLLWGFSIGVIPVLFYYASLSYIELQAVFLMLIVCFRIHDLANQDYMQIRQNPGWYALILIGFTKETVLPFLLCFLAVRWLVRIWKIKPWRNLRLADKSTRNLLWRWVIDETKIVFAVLFPIALYLVLRMKYAPARGYVAHFTNLLDQRVISAILRSLPEQFGLFLLLFLVGVILLLIRKEFIRAFLLILSFVGILLFFSLDQIQFVGYSRFNLFLLAPILSAATYFVNQVAARKKVLGMAVAILAIIAGLVISPVNIDGTKKPHWGSYGVDTAEHYYPYREALTWIYQNAPESPILIGGMTYDYYYGFYYAKYRWYPQTELFPAQSFQDDQSAMEASLFEASQKNIPIVLFHLQGSDIPQLADTRQYVLVQVFRNMAHTLVVFQKEPQ